MAKTEEYFAASFLLHHFLLRIILFPTTSFQQTKTVRFKTWFSNNIEFVTPDLDS